MAKAVRTRDHEEIRRWAESAGARPAQVEGTGGMLRFDFGEPDERLEPIDWDRFFKLFDSSGIELLHEPDGRFNKFVNARAGTARKKSGRKKSAAKKSSAKKSTAKKSTAKKPSAKKSSAKKSSAKKSSAKKSSRKSSGGRKYSRAASENVHKELDEMKRGKLRSGRSGKKVTSRKQAIAIGLSEARRKGEKVPARRKSSRRRKK